MELGAGVSINPVAFLVVQDSSVKLMPVDHSSCLDKLLDYVPDLLQKANEMVSKSIKKKDDRIQKIVSDIKCRQTSNNCSTNKEKSPEVKSQENKIAENEKQSNFQDVSDCLEADGEIFGEE